MSEDLKDFLRFVGGAILVVIVFVVMLAAGISRLEYPGNRAQFEATRQAVRTTPPDKAHVVYAQVLEMNQCLDRERACNARWWCDPFSVDEWNTVEPITIPE